MIFGYKHGKLCLRVGTFQVLGNLIDTTLLVIDENAFLFQYTRGTVGIRVGKFNRVYRWGNRKVTRHYEPLGEVRKVWYQQNRYAYQRYRVWVYRGKRLESQKAHYRIISINDVPCFPLFNVVDAASSIDAIRQYLVVSKGFVLLPGYQELWAQYKEDYLF